MKIFTVQLVRGMKVKYSTRVATGSLVPHARSANVRQQVSLEHILKVAFHIAAIVILGSCSEMDAKSDDSELAGSWICDPIRLDSKDGNFTVMEDMQTFDIAKGVGKTSGKSEYFKEGLDYPMLGIEYKLASKISVDKGHIAWKDREVDIVKVWGDWAGHFDPKWRKQYMDNLETPGSATFTIESNEILVLLYDVTGVSSKCKRR